jgi:HlyD family secretion protein
MDTPIAPQTKQRRLAKRVGIAALVIALISAAVIALRSPALTGNVQSVKRDFVTLATATQGQFEDAIALRGQAAPLSTVLLDAAEGGRVDRKLVEDGAMVQAGQPLAVLTNNSLQLEAIRSEAEVTNQLNNLRNLEITLARNQSSNEQTLNEIDWQIKRMSQKESRDQRLASTGFISTAALQDTQDEARYQRSRLRITEQAQRNDRALQQAQLEQLRATARQLQANLTLVRSNLEALTVRAPVAGRLTGFELSVGQSLARGQRLGQIDSPQAGKIQVLVDEHFASRVMIGIDGTTELDGKRWPLQVSAVNPQVRNGQFQVELKFAGEVPSSLRRGQTVQLKLLLSENRPALLIPNGAFLTNSAGAYVFVVADSNVVNKAENKAVKRAITLGRRNAEFVEVVSGLVAGEQIITSSYAEFADKDAVLLTK